jgi:hypothetical protein
LAPTWVVFSPRRSPVAGFLVRLDEVREWLGELRR